MPHHNRTLPADQDRQVAEFIAQAWADTRREPEPDKALHRALGYWVQPMAELLRNAYSRDELAVSCYVCADDLDISQHDYSATVQHQEGEMCGPCADRLETAIRDGTITSLIPDEQALLIPDEQTTLLPNAMPTPNPERQRLQTQAKRMRYRYANALGWHALIRKTECSNTPSD